MDFSPQNLDFLENDASDRPKPKNRNVRVGTAQKMAKTDFFYFRTYGRKTRKIDFLDICASDRPNFCGISNPGPPPTSPSKDSLLFPVDREIEPLRPKSRKSQPLPDPPGSPVPDINFFKRIKGPRRIRKSSQNNPNRDQTPKTGPKIHSWQKSILRPLSFPSTKIRPPAILSVSLILLSEIIMMVHFQ